MINLAPFNYRKALEEDGGPIQKISVGRTRLWDGTPCYSAAAELVSHLRPSPSRTLEIYDDADGGGTSRSRNLACFVAVSEALERWAYYAASTGPSRAALGFDVDDSTTGMAAFPSLTASRARKNAYQEAAERWSILEWWRGSLKGRLLPDRGDSLNSIEILNPFPGSKVVVIWAEVPEFAGTAFGFAAAKTCGEAVERAIVELTRNCNALSRFYARSGRTPSSVDVGAVADPLEKRLIHFSTPKGLSTFLARIAASFAAPSDCPLPEKIVDHEVSGPWSQYARVWRVLYRHELGADDERDLDIFAF